MTTIGQQPAFGSSKLLNKVGTGAKNIAKNQAWHLVFQTTLNASDGLIDLAHGRPIKYLTNKIMVDVVEFGFNFKKISVKTHALNPFAYVADGIRLGKKLLSKKPQA